MTLASIISPDRVIADLEATDHWPAIVELVDHLAAGDYIGPEYKESVLEAFREREDRSSTGMGGGLAIPHCFSEAVEEVTAIFGRSVSGVDFCAIDRAPVHFVTLFVVPREQYTTHLKTLAAIAKLLSSADVRNRLSAAKDSAEIFEILTVE